LPIAQTFELQAKYAAVLSLDELRQLIDPSSAEPVVQVGRRRAANENVMGKARPGAIRLREAVRVARRRAPMTRPIDNKKKNAVQANG
jgi:hypothetical protein